jgi:hypothetical protein
MTTKVAVRRQMVNTVWWFKLHIIRETGIYGMDHIKLYNINLSVFITEMDCVYCAVRIGDINGIRFTLNLQGVQ